MNKEDDTTIGSEDNKKSDGASNEEESSSYDSSSKGMKAMKKVAAQVAAQRVPNEVSQGHFCCSRCWQQSQGKHLSQEEVGIFVSLR